MKKSLLALVLPVFMLPAMASAATSVWELDNAHTEIGFKVRHMMLSHVHGNFKKAVGTLKADDKDLTKSTADFTIDVGAIDTGSEKRDEHLKSPDFFDAAKYPSITFKSAKVEKKGKGLKVHGFITMHGVTKPLVFEVQGPTKTVKDPFGLYRSAISAKAKLHRKDFGLSWNQAMESGGVMVGDEIDIEIDAEFVRKDSAEDVKPSAAPAGEPSPKKG